VSDRGGESAQLYWNNITTHLSLRNWTLAAVRLHRLVRWL